MSVLLPLYFAGLLALALPWLLHRFSLTRPPEVPFPSSRFLEATPPPVSRKRHLRYRSLLALRVLLVLALCLLFAEPVWRSLSTASNPEQMHLIAVDRSFSMRLGDRPERARQAVRDVLDEVPAGDSVQLLSFDTSLSPLSAAPSDPAEALGSLSSYSVGHGATDYGNVMQRLDAIAADQDRPTRIVLVTDSQSSGLPERLASLLAQRVQSLSVRDVSLPEEHNDFLLADARRARDGVHARVQVTIGSASATDPGEGSREADSDTSNETRRREIVISAGNEVLERRTVPIDGTGNQLQVFDPLTLPAGPIEHLDVRFSSNDALAEDDAVSAVLQDSKPRQITLVSDGTGRLGQTGSQARVFVSTALEASGNVEVRPVSGGGAIPATAQHAIVFSADSSVPDFVDSYVAQGGNALVVLTVDPSDMSVLDDAASPGRIDTAHPLALGDIDWFAVRYFATLEYRLTGDDNVLMESAAGVPLLMERRDNSAAGGAGRLLVLTDPLDGVSSDLPFQPAFVSLMRSVVDWFASSNVLPAVVDVGASLRLPANVRVSDADGNPLRDFSATGLAEDFTFVQPGVYTVVSQQGQRFLTVRTAPSESNISTIPDPEIQAWENRNDASLDTSDGDQAPASDAGAASATGSDAASDSRDNRQSGGPALASSGAGTGIALWYYALILLALSVLLEPLLANRRLTVRRDGS